MLFVLVLAAGATAAGGDVVVAVHPQVVRIETTPHAQNLNFDFVFTNRGEAPVRLREIVLEVFDAKGQMSARRKMATNGISPSIHTIPNRDLAAGARGSVFNPFVTFRPGLALARLDYTFVFGPADDDADDLPPVKVTVTPSQRRTATVLRAPMRGRLLVDDGHDFYAHHRRVDILHPFLTSVGLTKNPVRFGLDLCTIDNAGKRYRTDGKTREDWYSWDQPVYAPAAGTVVRAKNDRADYEIGKSGFDYGEMSKDNTTMNGNYVAIDHGHGEYSVLVHLRNGSIRVKPGDHVKAGEEIGRIGMSGDSYYPHLHMQMQDSADFASDGLPMYFHWLHASVRETTAATGADRHRRHRGMEKVKGGAEAPPFRFSVSRE